MSARLQDLLRQRALVQEHLAWLDREIAEASGSSPVTPAPPPAPRTPPPNVASARPANVAVNPEPTAVAAHADAIMAEYRVAPDTLKTDVRKGCFLYFAAALALVVLAVAALYLLIGRH